MFETSSSRGYGDARPCCRCDGMRNHGCKKVKEELGYRDATASKIIRKISLDLGWGDKTLKLVQNNGIGLLLKGHSTYRVFIKYCIIFEDFKNIPDSCLSLFYLGVIVCTHTRQVEHQLFSRTGRVQKNHKILRKKHNISWTPCIIWCDSYKWITTGI